MKRRAILTCPSGTATCRGPVKFPKGIAGNAGNKGNVDGIGIAARFHFIHSLAVDSAGNLYAVDRSNDSIRKITPVRTNWVVTTFAGVAGLAGSSDGTGAAALFSQPNSLAVDSSTNVYVADFGNMSFRKVSPNGTFQLKAIGTASGSLILETSTNLQTWTPIQTNATWSGALSVTVPITAEAYRFFRAHLVP